MFSTFVLSFEAAVSSKMKEQYALEAFIYFIMNSLHHNASKADCSLAHHISQYFWEKAREQWRDSCAYESRVLKSKQNK